MTTMNRTSVPSVRLEPLLTNPIADPSIIPMSQAGSLSIIPGDVTVGRTEVERLPAHLLLILDMSGSMKGTRLELLQKGLEHVFENMEDLDTLSVTRFGTDAYTEFTNMSKSDIINAGGFDTLDILGATEYIAAISEANNALNAVVSGTSARESRAHQILFLTDGGATDRSGQAAQWDSTIYGLIADMVSAGANFHTLGLGEIGDKHRKRLVEMTQAGLGQFFNAQTDQDVEDHLGQVLDLSQEIIYASPTLEIEVSQDVEVEDLGVAIKGLLLEHYMGPGNHSVTLPDIRKEEIVELTFKVTTDSAGALGSETTLVRFSLVGSPTSPLVVRWNEMGTDGFTTRNTKPITLSKTLEGTIAGMTGDLKTATKIGTQLERMGVATGDDMAITVGTTLKEGKNLNPAELQQRVSSTKLNKTGKTETRKSKSTK